MNAAAPRRRSPLRQLAMGLVASCLALTVVDVVVGLVLIRDGKFRGRPVPPYDLVFDSAALEKLQAPPDPYGRFDPELGWSIRPGGVSRNGLARANSDGIRADREFPLDPPPDRLRVATFGDSFTHGDEVANADMWQVYLERDRPDLEVINFGVNGYGTDQAYLRYRRDGKPYNPHVVVIGMMVENILRNVSVYRPAYYHGTAGTAIKPRFRLAGGDALELVPCPVGSRAELRRAIESRSLIPTLKEIDYWVGRAPRAYDRALIFRSSLMRILYGQYENSGRDPLPYYHDTEGEPFRVTARILESFHAEAIADGALYAPVLLFPSPPALQAATAGQGAFEPSWRTLIERLESRGIPVIDATESMAAAARRKGLEALAEANGHYSATGNAVIARLLAERLPAATDEVAAPVE